ncbi:MAG: SUMF1/EgtB/PvdO family nonheme iron enzyme, partial [Methylococcales bacterium]|nr:SUMF1/EgtB/PvdO family nonheme iron enzyme [Methylococcales bacterium]
GGQNRVNRGGSFNNTASNSRCANRNNNTPGNSNNNLGLRLAITEGRQNFRSLRWLKQTILLSRYGFRHLDIF